ncbi:DeoR family transcriptional regulator, partial [Mesorhizobium sp. M1C.F.Ca.ET.212.01.1.1]|uniref:DeoR family transcriptional regulator n=1 Tax=Mesorhizobium sp. M1C.F.Ca.ET.212.01.1.1 TaxID=2500527 RepID=UPI001FDF5D50
PQTIRKDLNDLCDQRLLTRIHGGALFPSGIENMEYEARRKIAADEKEAIGGAAQADDISETGLMMALRRWKTEAHFLIALADLSGEAETSVTVRRLSDLADACTSAAVDFLLLDAHRQGKLRLLKPADPARDSGDR